MFEDRWLKLITDNGTVNVQEEVPGLLFLGARESPPVAITNNVKIQGVDGELPGVITYDPYELTINIGFDGYDIEDVQLAEQKLRGIFNTKGRYFIIHSQTPGKKYAVDPPSIGPPNFLDATSLSFEVSFNVYKGYSESLHETDEFSLSNGNFQFESGVLPDSNTSYRFNRAMFEVLNGSSDTIDPRHRHKLKIIIRMTTDEGFRLVNKTTGDIFEYKSDLDINRQMTLDGGYPYIQQNDVRARCGRLTNHGLITLAPGVNKFEVWGNFKNLDVQFIFPFIYR